MDHLKIERQALADTVYNTYSPEHFPGSSKWRAYNAAEKALEAFDSAHPEVIAAIKAERAAKDALAAEERMARLLRR